VYQIDGPDNADPSAILAQISGQQSSAASGPADAQSQQAPTPVNSSTGARVQTGLNRATGGIADLFGLPVDTIANLEDLGKAGLGSAYMLLHHGAPPPDALNINSDRSGMVGSSEWIKKHLNQAGVNTNTVDPRDPAQRYIGAASEALPSVAAGLQSAGAVTGAVAGQAAAEHGAGPAGSLLAGTLGGAVPGAALATAGAIPRLAVGAGANDPQSILERQQALTDANNAGITRPNAAQVTGSKQAQFLQSLVAKIPGSAGYVAKQYAQQAKEGAASVQDIANSLAPRTGNRAAGLAIDNGIQGSFMDRTKATRSRLYDQVDALIPGDTPVDIGPYQGALQGILAPIKGAEAQSAVIRQSTNGSFIDALNSSLDHDLRQAALPEGAQPHTLPAKDGWQTAQGDYIPKGSQAAQQLAALNPDVLKLSGVTRVQQDPTPGYIVPSENGPKFMAEKDIQPATQLPYSAVQQLRSLVGQKMESDALTLTKRDANLARVYGGLSSVMKQAAEDAGPQAQNAFNRANTYYKAVQTRQQQLQRVIDAKGSPEGIYNAAMSGTKDGASTLHMVMQSLPQDAQRTVTATVLQRLGRAPPGQQNADGTAWSLSSFLTNYNKLSPEARAELFGRIDPSYQSALDGLTRFAARHSSESCSAG
jgi:hypothetical protein